MLTIYDKSKRKKKDRHTVSEVSRYFTFVVVLRKKKKKESFVHSSSRASFNLCLHKLPMNEAQLVNLVHLSKKEKVFYL